VVSHDRWFLDRTVDRLFCFRDGRLERFEGNYSSYLERQQAGEGGATAGAAPGAERGRGRAQQGPRAGSTPSRREGGGEASELETLAQSGGNRPSAPSVPPRRRSFKENRELETIERDLPLWEERRRHLEASLAAGGGGDYGQLEALTHELAELVERIHGAEERWLELSERPS
jgi:ATP-binding cassette subfamily F protein uup